MLSHYSTKTFMRASSVWIILVCLWPSVLQITLKKFNQVLLIILQCNVIHSVWERQLPVSVMAPSNVVVVVFRGRSNPNHPGASGHGDHCGREHCVTLSGGQWPCPWRFILLGFQRTAHRQGRQSLWASGWGEWPHSYFLRTCEWTVGTSSHLASLHPGH